SPPSPAWPPRRPSFATRAPTAISRTARPEGRPSSARIHDHEASACLWRQPTEFLRTKLTRQFTIELPSASDLALRSAPRAGLVRGAKPRRAGRPGGQVPPAPPSWAAEGRLLAALDPDVLALDLAGVPYRQPRRARVHRIGQLTKPDLLV